MPGEGDEQGGEAFAEEHLPQCRAEPLVQELLGSGSMSKARLVQDPVWSATRQPQEWGPP
jgi:hypothetical protein